MISTNYTVGSGSNQMIMRGGCDTGYYVSGSTILKGGCYTDLSVNNGGKILKNGSETGYFISGGSIMKDDYDKGYNIDWLFN